VGLVLLVREGFGRRADMHTSFFKSSLSMSILCVVEQGEPSISTLSSHFNSLGGESSTRGNGCWEQVAIAGSVRNRCCTIC